MKNNPAIPKRKIKKGTGKKILDKILAKQDKQFWEQWKLEIKNKMNNDAAHYKIAKKAIDELNKIDAEILKQFMEANTE